MAGPDSVGEWDPICLKPHLDLCLMSGLVWSPLTQSKAGLTDRPINNQLLSLWERHGNKEPSCLAILPPHPFPLFSPFIFPVITPPCWRGGTEGSRGVLKSFFFTASSLVSYGCFLCLAHRLHVATERAVIWVIFLICWNKVVTFPPESVIA